MVFENCGLIDENRNFDDVQKTIIGRIFNTIKKCIAFSYIF